MLNSAAFLAPTTGTVGSVGRNSVYGPTTWQLDMDLSRSFRIRERLAMQLRAEAFNLTNSFRAGANPSGAINCNTFGQIRTALDGRDMEFAVKFSF